MLSFTIIICISNVYQILIYYTYNIHIQLAWQREQGGSCCRWRQAAMLCMIVYVIHYHMHICMCVCNIVYYKYLCTYLYMTLYMDSYVTLHESQQCLISLTANLDLHMRAWLVALFSHWQRSDECRRGWKGAAGMHNGNCGPAAIISHFWSSPHKYVFQHWWMQCFNRGNNAMTRRFWCPVDHFVQCKNKPRTRL